MATRKRAKKATGQRKGVRRSSTRTSSARPKRRFSSKAASPLTDVARSIGYGLGKLASRAKGIMRRDEPEGER